MAPATPEFAFSTCHRVRKTNWKSGCTRILGHLVDPLFGARHQSSVDWIVNVRTNSSMNSWFSYIGRFGSGLTQVSVYLAYPSRQNNSSPQPNTGKLRIDNLGNG